MLTTDFTIFDIYMLFEMDISNKFIFNGDSISLCLGNNEKVTITTKKLHF